MSFAAELRNELSALHLLKHPFYQAWEMGELDRPILQEYAKQYYHHVKAFPGYIEAAIQQCDLEDARKLMQENLDDELGKHSAPHPDLWMQFANALSVNKTTVEQADFCDSIKSLISTFQEQCGISYPAALAAVYAYEHQIPEIARTKIDGLVEHYGVDTDEGLEFFTVHEKADIYHREACEKLLNELPESKRQEALNSAKKVAEKLWVFLTEMDSKRLAA